jgi:Skp family chaperone for outer membrane proteins
LRPEAGRRYTAADARVPTLFDDGLRKAAEIPVQREVQISMKCIPIAVIVSTLYVAGASAQATTPATQRPTTPTTTPAQTPPTQRPTTPSTPPAQQTPPPTLPTQQAPKPATPPPPFPAEAKIGFVSMQTIVAESKLGKAGSAKMKDLHDKNVASLKVKTDAITAQQQKIQQQQGVISEAALGQLTRQLEGMQRDLQNTQAQLTSDEQNLNEDLLTDFQAKVSPLIDALRVEKGLWVIFAVQDAENPGMISIASANEGLNLSLEIVKRLDAKTDPGGK